MNEHRCACPELKDLWKRFTQDPKTRISKHMLKHILLPPGLVERPRAASTDPGTTSYMTALLHRIANDAVSASLDSQARKRRQITKTALAAFDGKLERQRDSTPDEVAPDSNCENSNKPSMWTSVRKNVSNHMTKLG